MQNAAILCKMKKYDPSVYVTEITNFFNSNGLSDFVIPPPSRELIDAIWPYNTKVTQTEFNTDNNHLLPVNIPNEQPKNDDPPLSPTGINDKPANEKSPIESPEDKSKENITPPNANLPIENVDPESQGMTKLDSLEILLTEENSKAQTECPQKEDFQSKSPETKPN